MTTEARRVKCGAGALILAFALFLLAAAPAAQADTIYPVNQLNGTQFDTGADAYTSTSDGCKLLLGLLPVNDPATCRTETSINAGIGNPSPSLQQSYQAVANALSPLIFEGTAVATSPTFTVATGGATSFQVDRRADVQALLDLGTNATYTFTLVNEAGNTRQILATENVTDADNTFQSVLNEALPDIVPGSYHIEVSTTFRTALLSLALGRMDVDFDNVRLRVKDGTTTFGAPTAVTDPATNITATDASLNGRVNANGLASTYQFVYGTDPALTNPSTTTIGPFSAGMLTTAVNRSRDITGLTGCTTYYFRIEASNSDPASPSTGLTRSFRTDCKPTVTTLPATGVGPNSATFNSRINPEGPETKYYYEYGKVSSGTFGQRTPAVGSEVTLAPGHTETVPNSYPVDGLTPQTLYGVRVVAVNALGTTTGSPVLFTTTGTGQQGPPGAAGANGSSGTGNQNGSTLNNQILNLLAGDRRAILFIDSQKLVLPLKGRLKGRLRIRIICRPIAVRTCSGTVKVRSRVKINPSTQGGKHKKIKVTFGTGPVQLDRGRVGYAIVQVNAQRTDLVRLRKSIKVDVIAAMIDANNNRQNIRRLNTLKRGALPHRHKH